MKQKYRIVKVTASNGEVRYDAQERWWLLGWSTITQNRFARNGEWNKLLTAEKYAEEFINSYRNGMGDTKKEVIKYL